MHRGRLARSREGIKHNKCDMFVFGCCVWFVGCQLQCGVLRCAAQPSDKNAGAQASGEFSVPAKARMKPVERPQQAVRSKPIQIGRAASVVSMAHVFNVAELPLSSLEEVLRSDVSFRPCLHASSGSVKDGCMHSACWRPCRPSRSTRVPCLHLDNLRYDSPPFSRALRAVCNRDVQGDSPGNARSGHHQLQHCGSLC